MIGFKQFYEQFLLENTNSNPSVELVRGENHDVNENWSYDDVFVVQNGEKHQAYMVGSVIGTKEYFENHGFPIEGQQRYKSKCIFVISKNGGKGGYCPSSTKENIKKGAKNIYPTEMERLKIMPRNPTEEDFKSTFKPGSQFKDGRNSPGEKSAPKKSNRGGHNIDGVNREFPPQNGYSFRYFPLHGEFSYLIGNTIGTEEYFKNIGVQVKGTKQRCIEATNQETKEVGFLTYTSYSGQKNTGKFKPVPQNSVEIEPEGKTEVGTRHGENFKRDIAKAIEYDADDGSHVKLEYVEGSGDYKTAKYEIDGYDLTVPHTYALKAKRNLYPLKLVVNHARGTDLSYMNFIERLRNSGFDNFREMTINGKHYEFINIPGSDAVYSYSADSREFRKVDVSKLNQIIEKGEESDEFDVDEDLLEKVFDTDGGRRLTVDSMKEKFSRRNSTLRRWEQKEKKIAENLDAVLRKVPPDGNYGAEQVGGSNKSDIKVFSEKTKNDFFIECKLNYEKGEYFKFELDLNNKKLLHTTSAQLDDSQTASLNQIFGKSGEDIGTLLGILQTKARNQIEQFYDNMSTFLRLTSEFMSKRNEDMILMDFFGGIDILTNRDIGKIVGKTIFPRDLIPLLNGFSQYLEFVSVLSRGEGRQRFANDDIPFIGLYHQMRRNLQDLFNVGDGEVDSFLKEYDGVKGKPEAEFFNFLYTHICSPVISKTNAQGVLKLFNIEFGNAGDIAQKINDYYANVHGCKYLEIGTFPFPKDSEFNQQTWRSNIYVLNSSNDKIPNDPFDLAEKYKNIRNIDDLKNLKVTAFCAVADSCTSFDLKIFLGKTDGNGNADGENASEISFEDIKEINIKEEF